MVIFGKRIPMVFALLVWLIVWEVIGRLELLFLIPPFTDVLQAFIGLFVHPIGFYWFRQ